MFPALYWPQLYWPQLYWPDVEVSSGPTVVGRWSDAVDLRMSKSVVLKGG